jgi:7-keto-8-aminopelargonate synthetase-like enzyme
LADFTGFEDAITFSSASLASAGCIKALVDPFPYYRQSKQFDGLIIGDALNHASLVDAARLAKSDYVIYRHNDMADLERLLKKYIGLKGLLIVTDGVFSMDGTLADLKALRRLADTYNALLMVDDSHGFGVLGSNGEGTARYLGMQPDILLASFTKGGGSIGGFVSASQKIVKYLRVVARTAIFSDPIPPALAAGLITMLNILKSSEGENLRDKMRKNTEYLRSNLKRLGFDILGEHTPIVPLILGNEPLTMEFSSLLFEMNIIAPAIRYPAVPHGKERLRFSITAGHQKKHLDHLIESCQKIGKRLSVI